MWLNPQETAQETADLVTLTKETLNGKLLFLCATWCLQKTTPLICSTNYWQNIYKTQWFTILESQFIDNLELFCPKKLWFLHLLLGMVFSMVRSSHRRCSLKKSVLKNFVNFTGKQLYWSPPPSSVYGLEV